MPSFGERIKGLREQNKLLQREVAAKLEIDTPMLSKIERGERLAKKEQVLLLAELFKYPVDDLLSIWLSDKVYEVVKDEKIGLKAIQLVEQRLKRQK
jgi:transcriptional regulator with XRE-family HTH domain